MRTRDYRTRPDRFEGDWTTVLGSLKKSQTQRLVAACKWLADDLGMTGKPAARQEPAPMVRSIRLEPVPDVASDTFGELAERCFFCNAPREMAREGAETVVTRYTPEANVLTTFFKRLDRAGLTRWPDAFQNLRRSRETELMAVLPIKDVGLWIGNSVPVAMRRYAMAMEDSFSRAVMEGAIEVSRKTPHSMPLNSNHGQSAERPDAEKPRKNPPLILTEAGFSYPARTRT